MTLYRAFFALFLALAALLGSVVTAPSAESATCTTVWLTVPSYNERFNAGTKRCVWPSLQTNGWVNVYQFDDRNKPVVDWVSPFVYTKTPPNNGLYKPNADRVRDLAAKYDVRLQFAYKAGEAVGCVGAYAGEISGVYSPSPVRPGKGLVRIGTGKISTCMRETVEVMDVAKHEIAHVLTERKCPRIFNESRFENITDAYAWKYLNASDKSAGNYGFTTKDLARAVEIAHREC